MRHIIVCGYSRGGTTMFYNMLRNSVSGYKFFDEETLAASVIGSSADDMISKRPRDLFQLETILKENKLFKQILLLIVIRDIRSIITSYHYKIADDYLIGYDYCYSINPNGTTPYNGPGIIRTAKTIATALEDERFQSIVVRYEDLILQPRMVEARLADRAHLAFDRHFEDFHAHPIPESLTPQLNGVRPVDKTRLDAWKDADHAQRIRSQFSRCPELFDLLIEYGYEEDRDWFEIYRRKHPPGISD